VKRKKRASDTAVPTPGPPTKSRLLDKTSAPKNTSLPVSTSYDFDDHVTHQPLVPRVSELEVGADRFDICVITLLLYILPFRKQLITRVICLAVERVPKTLHPKWDLDQLSIVLMLNGDVLMCVVCYDALCRIVLY